jgi:DNA-binding NarL/FixJ family response regulator
MSDPVERPLARAARPRSTFICFTVPNEPRRQGDFVTERVAALTQSDLEVLRLLAQGLTNHEIGGRLWLSPGGVKHRVRQILVKLGQPNAVAAVAYALGAKDAA